MTRKNIYKSFILSIFLLIIAGCSSYDVYNKSGIIQTRGEYIMPYILDKISLGMSKNEVISLIGSPNFKGTFDDNIWYYGYQKISSIAFLSPKVLEQNTLELIFNKKGFLISKNNIYIIKNKRN